MSGLITNYLAVGLASARPVSPIITTGAIAIYFASDTGAASIWDASSWQTLSLGALLAANNLSDLANAGTARTNLGATTVGANVFTLTNPSAITFPRFNADNSVSTLSASAFRTAIGAGTGTGDLVAANNLSDVASASTARSNLGLAIGTNVQAWDADLDALAALSGTSTIYYRSAANTWSAVTMGTGMSFSGGALICTVTGGSGTVTSVSAGTGLSGGPITTTGSLALDLTHANVWTGKQDLGAGGDLTPATAPSTTAIGYLGAPQNTQNGAYTTVMADAGKHLYHTSGSAHTWTIDSNANVAYPVGTILTFVNENAGGNVTLAITSDTLRWGSSTGSRTLAANGTATALKVASTTWRLTGDGIT